jgi:hypothetical protein
MGHDLGLFWDWLPGISAKAERITEKAARDIGCAQRQKP